MRYLVLIGFLWWGWLGAQARPAAQVGIPDSVRVDSLATKCAHVQQHDLGLALRYGQQGLQLARRIGYLRGELTCLSYLASAAMSHQDLVQAEQFTQQLLRLTEHLPPRLLAFRAEAWRRMGDMAVEQEDYWKAVGLYRKQLAAVRMMPAPKLRDSSVAYSALMSAYLNISTSTDNPPDSALRQAIHFARLDLPLSRRLTGAPHMLATNLMAQGLIASLRQQYDSAVVFIGQARLAYHRANATYQEAYALRTLAEMQRRQHAYAVSVATARQARQLAHAIGDTEGEANNYDIMAESLAGLGQGMPAYEAARKARHLTDSIRESANEEAVRQLQVKFDTSRKEEEIQNLTRQQRQQHQRLWTLGIVLLVVAGGLAGIAVLALRLRRSRAQLAAQNEELAQARATQDRLYSVIAHDLRSPLTAFTGLADMVRTYREQGELAALDELTGEVGQTAERLTGLLDNLLHWAASQTGELAYCPETLDAAALLHDTAALYAPAARARQVTLAVEATDGLPSLWADYNMTLTQLRNLAGNALKVAPKGSTITLAAQPGTAGGVELLVRDAGPGLTAEQLAALQSPVPQARPDGRRQRGTGLGLPLVRQLAARQQGAFRLESVPGQGTTARLLPATITEVVAC